MNQPTDDETDFRAFFVTFSAISLFILRFFFLRGREKDRKGEKKKQNLFWFPSEMLNFPQFQ